MKLNFMKNEGLINMKLMKDEDFTNILGLFPSEMNVEATTRGVLYWDDASEVAKQGSWRRVSG